MLGSAAIAINNLVLSSDIYQEYAGVFPAFERPDGFLVGGGGASTNTYTDIRLSYKLVDKLLNVQSIYDAPEKTWVSFRSTNAYYSSIENKVYTATRLKSDHPSNTSNDDNELWFCSFDLNNGDFELIVKFQNYQTAYFISVIDVIDNNLYYAYSANGVLGKIYRIDINTGVVTFICNSLSSGPSGGYRFLDEGNYIVSRGFSSSTNQLKTEVLNLDSQNVTSLNFDTTDLLPESWAGYNCYTSIAIKGSLVYFALMPIAPLALEDRTFKVLIYDNTGNYIKSIEGLNNFWFTYANSSIFITSNNVVYVSAAQRLRIVSPGISGITKILKSGNKVFSV